MLTKLLIQNLRNIQACELALSSGFNFIIGANGSGKTSVLEAVYYLGHGRSFRTAQTNRVINHDASHFVVHGRLVDKDYELPVGVLKSRTGQAEIKIGNEKGQRLVKLAEVLPMQLINPEGFALLADGPKFRRAFIDWGVFHAEPQFYLVWSRARRLTKQRNALLRTATNYRELKVWDQELVPLVEKIDQWRAQYVERISQNAAKLCQTFLPEYNLKFSYSRGWDKKADYETLLAENFVRDLQLGYTLSGPHKADLRISVDNTPVEDVLSRGQLKLLMCALRLAQGQQLSLDKTKQSIYLIDDFASELDTDRRKLLASELKATGAQVFVTANGAEQIASMADENSKMFHVEQGKITAIN